MTSIAQVRAGLPPGTLSSVVAVCVTGAAFGLGLLLAREPLYVGLGAVGLLALLVSFARPEAATYVVVAILYSNAAAVAVRDHGLPDFAALAYIGLLALPLGDHLLLRKRPIAIARAFPFLIGYLIVQVIAAAAARDPTSAADNLINFLISGLGMFFVVTNVVRSFSTLRRVTWTVLVVAGVLGALSTFQAVTKTYGQDYLGFSTVEIPGREQDEVLATVDVTPRAQGPIGEQNRYAQVMLVLLPIGAGLALGQKKRSLRVLAWFLTVLALAGMASTFSRGAALGLLVVVGVGVMFRYVKLVQVVAMALVLGVTLLTFPRYAERLFDLQGLTSLDRGEVGDAGQGDTGNLRGRATATLAALYVWADHPIVGVGRGQFPQYYREYAGIVAESGVDTRIDQTREVEAHNLFSSVAAETGAVGFLTFFAAFLVTMRSLYRARSRWLQMRPDVAHLATGFLLALVAYLASGIALHLSYERYLWFLLALAAAAGHLALKGDPLRDYEIDAH